MIGKEKNLMKFSADSFVVYYVGSYGPTIRINFDSADELTKLKQAFLCLPKEQYNEVSLKNRFGLEMNDLEDLILKFTTKRISSKVSRDSKGRISWVLSADDCDQCVGLIDGLLDGGSGHQYLTSEDVGFLITVALKE